MKNELINRFYLCEVRATWTDKGSIITGYLSSSALTVAPSDTYNFLKV